MIIPFTHRLKTNKELFPVAILLILAGIFPNLAFFIAKNHPSENYSYAKSPNEYMVNSSSAAKCP
jgi:hypothetical protein